MKYRRNWAPTLLCGLMMIFSATMGIFTPAPSFYPVWAGMWGVFTGITICDHFSDDDEL